MKKFTRKMISLALVLCMTFIFTIPALAGDMNDVYIRDFSRSDVTSIESSNDNDLSDETERITFLNDTEFYFYSNNDYNFSLQKSTQGYVDFAIYYVTDNMLKTGNFCINDVVFENNVLKTKGLSKLDPNENVSSGVENMGIREISQLILANIDENVDTSFSPELIYSEVEIESNELINEMLAKSPPYSSYQAAAEAFCGAPYQNKFISQKWFTDNYNNNRTCSLNDNHSIYYTRSNPYSAIATVAISGVLAFSGFPEALILQIFTIVQNAQGIYVFVKSFTSEVYNVEDVYTKIAYIDGTNWYWAGSTKKYSVMNGDKGWGFNTSSTFSNVHHDFNNNTAIIDKAISNYLS